MPLSRRGYPVCLLYPWPWWQANKTPGPVLQDIDDSADFDSPSHYNYYNGTFNSTPSINDFISQRERRVANVIRRASRVFYPCVLASPFFSRIFSPFPSSEERRMLFSREIFAYRWKAMEFIESFDLFYEQTFHEMSSPGFCHRMSDGSE